MDPRRRRARAVRKLQRRLPDLRLLAEDTQVAPARAQGCALVRADVVTRREADRLRRGLGSLRENNRSDDQDRLARDEQRASVTKPKRNRIDVDPAWSPDGR